MQTNKRKSTAVKASQKTSRTKKSSSQTTHVHKWEDALHKMKELENNWAHKLLEKTKELKNKIADVMESTYSKAYEQLSTMDAKKLKAHAKQLAIAEEKFEKRFAKEIAKLRKPLHKVKTAISNVASEASNKFIEMRNSMAGDSKKTPAKKATTAKQTKAAPVRGKKATTKNVKKAAPKNQKPVINGVQKKTVQKHRSAPVSNKREVEAVPRLNENHSTRSIND